MQQETHYYFLKIIKLSKTAPIITRRKAIQGFLFLSYMGIGLCLAKPSND